MSRSTKKILKRYFLLIIFPVIGISLQIAGSQNKKDVTANQAITNRKVQEGIALTSTDFRYQKGFEKTLECYSGFQNIYQDKFSTAIPGLEATLVEQKINGQMVPQGLCFAGDYMLITAYDNTRSYLRDIGRKVDYQKSCSVIYVLSNRNPQQRELLTTIVLPDVNHVGGVTFDGSYIWIAKSTTKRLSAIDYRLIDRAAISRQPSIKLQSYTQEVDCGVTASFVTYDDNKLWIGTYQNLTSHKGTLRSFTIEKNGHKVKLKQEESYIIPAYANGIAFVDLAGRHCMAIVSSLGRYVDSKIHLYEVVEDKLSNRKLLSYQGAYTFPPMAEEVAADGNRFYFLFESAATCYSTITLQKCSYVVDRVCAVSADEMFQKLVQHSPVGQDNQKNNEIYNYLRNCAYIHERRNV